MAIAPRVVAGAGGEEGEVAVRVHAIVDVDAVGQAEGHSSRE